MLCRRINTFLLRSIRNYSLPPNFTIGGPTNTKSQQDSFHLRQQDIADTLKYDPNLAGFYDPESYESSITSDSSSHLDPFDLSDISQTPISSENSQIPSYAPSIDLSNGPQTMTTEDFMRLMENEVHGIDPDVYIKQSTQSSTPITKQTLSTSISNPPTNNSQLKEFLHNDDIAHFDKFPNLIEPHEILNTELPLIVISKFTDPRLNLSIEKYVYDNYPSPKDPINKFSRRLVLYKNSSCIVLGKNQNVYREINLRLASALSIPILRRFSGGGTVVHDLGNVNFSFMCSKDDFSRTQYTSELINAWNTMFPNDILEINNKGDMIRSCDQKKISGSAFQISKGKSLHHGTMLLNSDLKTLSKLLKIDPNRKNAIKDRATNSIPSPVINTNIDTNSFIDIATKAFVSKFGVPTNLTSKLNKLNYSNLSLIRVNNIEAQILKLNDLNSLPEEVWQTYSQLQSWDWTFGKSPRFQMDVSIENLQLTFDVNQGRIVGLEYNEKDPRLIKLIEALSTKDQIVNFSNVSLANYIHDKPFLQQLSWKIDQSLNYKNIGILQHTL